MPPQSIKIENARYVITVDAEQSIHDQHQEIRRLFREGEQRPWSDWNLDAIVEWLAMRDAQA